MAYYSTYNMMTLLTSPKPTVQDPTAFGFKESDEILVPVKAVRSIPEEYTVGHLQLQKKMAASNVHAAKRTALYWFCTCQNVQTAEKPEQCQNPSGVLAKYILSHVES